jgi:hypothetical protein
VHVGMCAVLRVLRQLMPAAQAHAQLSQAVMPLAVSQYLVHSRLAMAWIAATWGASAHGHAAVTCMRVCWSSLVEELSGPSYRHSTDT